jgi:type III secretion protein J
VRPTAPRLLGLALAALAAAGCQTAVLNGLSEQDTNHAIAALQRHGITAAKEPDNPEARTWKVLVPSRDTPKAWTILQQYRLPAQPGRRFQDVFGKNKLVVAPIEEKALFLEALQGEIGHTLESVSGIVSARVHVALPETDLSGQTRGEAKASVMLEYHPDASSQSPLRPDEVQRLVASGVSDLKPENVSVIMKPVELVESQQSVNWVAFGPIIVAEQSLAPLKILTVGVVLVFVVLGATLYWNGRVMNDLRFQLQAAQRQARAIQKTPKSAA